MIEVALTRDQLLHAGAGGMQRQLDALLRRRGSHFEHVDSWQHHVCGAMSEMAVAKALGKFWFPCYDNPLAVPADVGERIEVRSQQHQPKREPFLVLRERDKDDHAYVLVTYAIPRFYIHGFMWGKDGKQDEWKQPASGDKPPAWFVPKKHLHPLPAQLAAQPVA